MGKIEETISKPGYAWMDENDELIWAWAEEMEDLTPADRPKDCTPVQIEISPVEEWLKRRQNEYESLKGAAEGLNSLTSELKALSKMLDTQGD